MGSKDLPPSDEGRESNPEHLCAGDRVRIIAGRIFVGLEAMVVSYDDDLMRVELVVKGVTKLSWPVVVIDRAQVKRVDEWWVPPFASVADERRATKGLQRLLRDVLSMGEGPEGVVS